ncbi:Protein BZZ1 [Tilletia horrida]|nr:Protein BZZ1 [Tilletia horrida]
MGHSIVSQRARHDTASTPTRNLDTACAENSLRIILRALRPHIIAPNSIPARSLALITAPGPPRNKDAEQPLTVLLSVQTTPNTSSNLTTVAIARNVIRKRTSSAVGANIAIAQELATSFLTERSALEREYAQKLQALVKKARTSRDKRLTDSIAGPDPSKAWSQDAVRRSTLFTFLNTLFVCTEQIAQHHSQAADSLTASSTELSNSARRKEENRKRQSQFAQQLIGERDEVYAARVKAKAKYDELCSEVESARQKREKAAADDRHADRAAKQFEQAEMDMWNGKNAYIIAIAKANASKTKFYRQDLPAAQDALQRLWATNTTRIASILTKSLNDLRQQNESIQAQLISAIEKAATVKASEDHALFIEYNHRRFVEPSDWAFEPCQGFFDTPDMTTNGSPKTVLQNVLIKDRKKIADLTPTIESKRRELSGLEELLEAYQGNESLGSVDDVMDNLIDSRRQFSTLESSKTLLEAEIAEITRAIGDDEGEARPHRFKHQAFAVPTTCNFCGGTIWGLSKQGAVCRPCGYTAHIKCEIKVPADCKSAPSSLAGSRNSTLGPSGGGGGLGSGATTISRASSVYSSSTVTSTGSGPAAAMTISNAFGGPPQLGGVPLRARVLYAFDATSPFELSVRPEGGVVDVLEEDEDGSGWTKVRLRGEQGLVPTTYVEFLAPGDEELGLGRSGKLEEEDEEELPDLGELDGDAIEGSGSRGAGGTLKGLTPAFANLSAPSAGRVRALYDFAGGSGPDELALAAGDVVELSARGFAYAEGWCEGTLRGRTGIFPAAYVERL